MDFDRLDGPGPAFRLDRWVELRGRGEGILSKSTSEVRATGRIEERLRPAVVGVEGGLMLTKCCTGPNSCVAHFS